MRRRADEVRPGDVIPMARARSHLTRPPRIRTMTMRDALAVARVHAESWRATYRGILSDDFLDGPVHADRLGLWRRRLRSVAAGRVGLVATLGEDTIVGFAYAIVDDDAERGTLLDNLHVAPTQHGHGIGRALLHALAASILRTGSRAPVHLWAYEANRRTRAFYEHLGAMPLERTLVSASGGDTAAAWCYAWPSAAALREATARAGQASPRRLAR